MTSLTEFIDQWKEDALTSIVPVKWCIQCETREQSKREAPYCSILCREAAERAALWDRR